MMRRNLTNTTLAALILSASMTLAPPILNVLMGKLMTGGTRSSIFVAAVEGVLQELSSLDCGSTQVLTMSELPIILTVSNLKELDAKPSRSTTLLL